MTISKSQRNFIAKHQGRLSYEELARQLRVREKEVLRTIWEMESGIPASEEHTRLCGVLDLLIEQGIYILAAAAPLFFIKYIHQFATLSKIIFVETAAGILLTLWTIKGMLEERLTFAKSPLMLLAALFFTWSITSALWAVNPFETIHQSTYLFSCLLLAFLVHETVISNEQVKRFVTGATTYPIKKPRR